MSFFFWRVNCFSFHAPCTSENIPFFHFGLKSAPYGNPSVSLSHCDYFVLIFRHSIEKWSVWCSCCFWWFHYYTRLPLSSFLQLSVLAFRPKFFGHYSLVKSLLYQVQTVTLNYKVNSRYVSRRSNDKNIRNTWRELKLKLEQTRWRSHKLQNRKLQLHQVWNAMCFRASKWRV